LVWHSGQQQSWIFLPRGRGVAGGRLDRLQGLKPKIELPANVVAEEAAEKVRWHNHSWLCAQHKGSKTRTGKSACAT
jgi:hypothetical protein